MHYTISVWNGHEFEYFNMVHSRGALELFFDGGVPHETLKWGS